MAKQSIQVVLRDDVDNLGRSGELVRVKPGFARNYLIPKGLAAVATRGNVAQIEHERRTALARAEKQRAAAESQAKSVEGTTVEIPARAGEEDKLFGSVGNKDIASALGAKGIEIDRKKILLPEPIRALGETEVSIKFGHDVTATIKVVVTREE